MERSQNLLSTCAVSLLLLGWTLILPGCASMSSSITNTEKLAQIEADLENDPHPVIDAKAISEVAPTLEEEEASLSAMTPEKFLTRVKGFFLKLVNLDPNQEAAFTAFSEGVEHFDRGEFEAAAKALRIAYYRWPDSPLQEDAIFLRAEAFFFANQYGKAERQYELLLKKYDSTRYLDRVSPRLFAIAQYWDKLDQANNYSNVIPNFQDKKRPVFSTYQEAVKAYRMIPLHDPNGLWADHALMAAGNAHYIRGKYVSAAECYDQLIKSYPQTRHLLPACELNLSAKLLMYQGPEYDGKELEDAEELADRLITQFSNQLGPRKDEIAKTKNRIIEARAERDIAMAQFFESKRQYASARYYYMLVMDEFPQTVAATVAKERYDEILEYPAEPKDYFSWLEKIFPED